MRLLLKQQKTDIPVWQVPVSSYSIKEQGIASSTSKCTAICQCVNLKQPAFVYLFPLSGYRDLLWGEGWCWQEDKEDDTSRRRIMLSARNCMSLIQPVKVRWLVDGPTVQLPHVYTCSSLGVLKTLVICPSSHASSILFSPLSSLSLPLCCHTPLWISSKCIKDYGTKVSMVT